MLNKGMIRDMYGHKNLLEIIEKSIDELASHRKENKIS
jgi:hypothetical protein